MLRLAGILLALLLAGCAKQTPMVDPYRHGSPQSIEGVVLSADVANALPYWQAEARRHGIANALIVVCHGDEFMGGWWAFPDAPMKPMPVDQLLWTLRREHPDKVLVAVICNPGGLPCTVPDVFYARESVWMKPGDRWRTLETGVDFGIGCLDSFACTRIKGCE